MKHSTTSNSTDTATDTPCDNCAEQTDVGTIPCGACGVDCRECVDCVESRYVANDGFSNEEPTMYVCVFCRKVQKRGGNEAHREDTEYRDAFETGYVDLDMPADDLDASEEGGE